MTKTTSTAAANLALVQSRLPGLPAMTVEQMADLAAAMHEIEAQALPVTDAQAEVLLAAGARALFGRVAA